MRVEDYKFLPQDKLHCGRRVGTTWSNVVCVDEVEVDVQLCFLAAVSRAAVSFDHLIYFHRQSRHGSVSYFDPHMDLIHSVYDCLLYSTSQTISHLYKVNHHANIPTP